MSASTTHFIVPPSEMDIEYTFDFHLSNNPNYPAFMHPDPEGNGKRWYTYGEIVPAIHRAGKMISKVMGVDVNTSPTPLVAVFAEINNLTYATIVLGLMRAGITAFLISPRFHPTVVAELLRMAGPSHMLVNNSLREKAHLAFEELAKTPHHAIPKIIDAPLHHQLFTGDNAFDRLPRHSEEFAKRALILHSSCSTSNCPKIIEWASHYVRSNSLTIGTPVVIPGKFGFMADHQADIDYSDVEMEGKIFGAQSAEFFHTAGLCFLFWQPRAGFVMAILLPEDPKAVIPADRDMAFEGFVKCQVAIVWSSPRNLESWSNDPKKVAFLAQRECIVFGGSQLSKAAGDRLSSNGVKICNVYGATECGYISKFISEPQSEDWEYFSLNPGMNVQLVPRENGTFETVVVSQKGFHETAVINTTWNGRKAYATGDGLVAHPHKKGYYKVIGRNKDQILLSSGQVVDPIELEDSFRDHEHIKSAVVFGHGRPFLGVLIWSNARVSEQKEGSTDGYLTIMWSYISSFMWQQPVRKDENEGVERFWSMIEEKNKNLPVHAQFRKETFLVADQERPFHIGEKGLPKRSLILDDYRKDIEKCYMACL